MSAESLRFFYFDLGNVLLSFDHRVACEQIATLVGCSANRVERLLYMSGVQTSYENGQMESEQFYEAFSEEVGARPDYAAFCYAASDMFRINTRVVPIVCQLFRAGHRLGVLSNTCEMHWQHICRTSLAGIGPLFETAVLSYELKLSKPDSAICAEAVQRTGEPPERVFFVDDRPENVEAARGFGIDAVLFESPSKLAADLRGRGVPFNY